MKRILLTIAIVAASVARADLAAEINLAQTAGFEGANVQRFYGPEPVAIFGAAAGVAYGNIDGDAYDDIVIGAPEYGEDAGIVYIIYGAAGFSAFEYGLGVDPLVNVRMTIIFGEQGRVGQSVACGDVDADGFDDVLIGAPTANVPGTLNTGAAALVYGSADMPGTPQGIGTTLTLEFDNPTIPNGLTFFYGIDPNDDCGRAVALGDMTTDGRADVLIGAPQATIAEFNNGGEVYFFNSSLNRRGTGAIATGNPQTGGWYKLSCATTNARLGTALAIGDVSGEGYGDMALGAPGVGGGRVFVFSGADNPLGFFQINFSAMGYGEIAGTGNDDLFGSSISIGNFDGDQNQDLLIGAPRADATPEDNIGGVFLVLGGQSLIQDAYMTFNNTPGTFGEKRILGAASGTGLGASVALGDVNGDGLDDIIYGRTNTNSTSGTNVGTVGVTYAGDVPTILDLAVDSPDVTIFGGTTDDLFGAALAAAGDFNNDGKADILAASNNGASPYGDQPNASGYAAVVQGDGSAEAAFIQHGFTNGDTPFMAIGGGNLSPTFRLLAKFNAGTAGYLQVELKRTPADLSNLGPSAKEYWLLSTPRTGWTQADLTFQYTDDQIEGISSSQLKLAQAAAPEGPWTDLNPVIDFDKRTLSVSVAELGYFAIYTNLPVISLIGEPTLFHECGTAYVDAGATAADAEDGDLTSAIDTESTVDDQTPGIYTVTYNVSDSNSNVAQTVVRTVTVRDLTPPQLTRNGGETVFVQCGSPYNDLGAVSTDTCDGALTVNVDSSQVVTATPGSYTVTYSATDNTGNNTQITRTVEVVDTNGPVIDLVGGDITLDCGEPYLEPGFTAIDACEGDKAGEVVITFFNVTTNQTVQEINENDGGVYRIDYNVQDSLANAATTVSRSVEVAENCDLKDLLCTTQITAAQQVPTNNSNALGSATWRKVGTGKVVLEIEHTVVSPTLAHIHAGAPGQNGGVVFDFGSPVSPIVKVFTIAQYNTFANDPHYINIHSAAFGDGEIRGDIACAPVGGEDGFQTSDQNGDFVISLSELLRVIQFYNSLGYHCADSPGDTEDGYVPGTGVNQTCEPYDTDYNPQDWTISLTELLRVIQFYNSLGYNYCPGQGTEDDFCPGL